MKKMILSQHAMPLKRPASLPRCSRKGALVGCVLAVMCAISPASRAQVANTEDPAVTLRELRTQLTGKGASDPDLQLRYAAALQQTGQGAESGIVLNGLRGRSLTPAQQAQFADLAFTQGVWDAAALQERGQLAAAYDKLAPLLAQRPKDINALGLQGRLYAMAGDGARAMEIARDLIASNPKSAQAQLDAALIAAHARDTRFADSALQSALNLAPNDASVARTASQTYRLIGKPDKAAELAQRATVLQAEAPARAAAEKAAAEKAAAEKAAAEKAAAEKAAAEKAAAEKAAAEKAAAEKTAAEKAAAEKAAAEKAAAEKAAAEKAAAEKTAAEKAAAEKAAAEKAAAEKAATEKAAAEKAAAEKAAAERAAAEKAAAEKVAAEKAAAEKAAAEKAAAEKAAAEKAAADKAAAEKVAAEKAAAEKAAAEKAAAEKAAAEKAAAEKAAAEKAAAERTAAEKAAAEKAAAEKVAADRAAASEKAAAAKAAAESAAAERAAAKQAAAEKIAADRAAAAEKAAAEKAAAEKAAAEKVAADRVAAAEKAAAAKAAAETAAAERAAARKAAAEKTAADKAAAAEKAAAEKAAAEKAAADRAAAKVAADRAAAAKAAAEKAAAESAAAERAAAAAKAAAEKAVAERAAAEKTAAEKAAAERAAAEQAAAEKAAADKAAAERAAAEKAAAYNAAAEKAAAERSAAERAAAEKATAERSAGERAAAEKATAERSAAERAAAEKAAADKAAVERAVNEKSTAERAAAEKAAAEKAASDRAATDKAATEKAATEKAAADKAAAQKPLPQLSDRPMDPNVQSPGDMFFGTTKGLIPRQQMSDELIPPPGPSNNPTPPASTPGGSKGASVPRQIPAPPPKAGARAPPVDPNQDVAASADASNSISSPLALVLPAPEPIPEPTDANPPSGKSAGGATYSVQLAGSGAPASNEARSLASPASATAAEVVVAPPSSGPLATTPPIAPFSIPRPGTPGLSSIPDQMKALIERQHAREAYELGLEHPELMGDPLFDYVFGVAAVDSGRVSLGVLALERVLLTNPADDLARLELARAYFALGEFQRAREEFDEVKRHRPPAGVVKTVDQFLEGIKRKEGEYKVLWGAYGEFGLGYNSNVNAATAVDSIILPFIGPVQLAASSRPLPSPFGVGAVGGSVSVPIDYDTHAFLNVNASTQKYSQADGYNLGGAVVTGGLRYNDGPNEYKVLAFGSLAQLSVVPVPNTAGGGLEYSRRLNETESLLAGVSAIRLGYPSDFVAYNSNLSTALLGYRQVFPLVKWQPVVDLTATFAKQTNISDRPDLGRTLVGGNVQVSFMPNAQTGISLGAGYAQSNYGSEDLLYQANRSDGLISANAVLQYSLTKELSARAEFTYFNNLSNLGLYSYNQWTGALKLRYSYASE